MSLKCGRAAQFATKLFVSLIFWRNVISMPNELDWRNGVIKRLDQQIAMVKKTFLSWMQGEISDKQFAFEMSNHLAAFSEILKADQE